MPTVATYNMTGSKVGEIQLNDAVFGVEVNEAVMHQAVVRQLSNERLGTHATKTRGLVRGGGRKPWKQKGTGRARVGSTRSPLWIGGGTVFGPQPHDHYKAMPRKARRLAVKSALSEKVNLSDLYVLEEMTMSVPKTKEVLSLLNDFNVGNAKALFITEGDVNVERSARNIQGVKAIACEGINIFDLLHYDKLFITKGAVAKIEEVLG